MTTASAEELTAAQTIDATAAESPAQPAATWSQSAQTQTAATYQQAAEGAAQEWATQYFSGGAVYSVRFVGNDPAPGDYIRAYSEALFNAVNPTVAAITVWLDCYNQAGARVWTQTLADIPAFGAKTGWMGGDAERPLPREGDDAILAQGVRRRATSASPFLFSAELLRHEEIITSQTSGLGAYAAGGGRSFYDRRTNRDLSVFVLEK